MIKNKEFKPIVKEDGRVLVKARLSYVHLDAPWSGSDANEKKYCVSCIIPKSDKATLEALGKAVDMAKEEGKAKKWGVAIPKKLSLPLRDGDEEKEDEAYADSFFFNASSKQPVKTFNRLKEEIDPKDIYSGAWGLVSLKMFPYEAAGNKGVGVGLNQVLLWADDEKLGGGGGGNDFADLDIEDEADDLDDL